jgi:hypothetical protein
MQVMTFAPPGRIQFTGGDVARLGYRDECFDAIIGVGLLEYPSCCRASGNVQDAQAWGKPHHYRVEPGVDLHGVPLDKPRADRTLRRCLKKLMPRSARTACLPPSVCRHSS